MASANSTTLPTMLDVIKRTAPDGAIAKIVETLQERTPLLQDAVVKEGNLPTGDRVTTRTGLPAVTWRMLNQGIAPTKGQTSQFDESCGMLEGLSKVDVDVAKLNGNEAAFRASEDLAFLQSMKHEIEAGAFYHSTTTDPERFMGLSPRLDATTADTPGETQIIKVDADASGSDQTSMWLVCWGPDTVYLMHPKGSQVGLSQKDLGEVLTKDSGGTNEFLAYVTKWQWKIGLVVKDWRYLVRVANIDAVNMAANTSEIIDAAIDAYYRLEDPNMGRCAWYVNRSLAAYLHKFAKNDTKNSTLSIENIAGRPVTSLLGIPIRVTDALTSTEAAVS